MTDVRYHHIQVFHSTDKYLCKFGTRCIGPGFVRVLMGSWLLTIGCRVADGVGGVESLVLFILGAPLARRLFTGYYPVLLPP